MLKSGNAVGIEFDSRSIRAAVLQRGKGKVPEIRNVQEISGSFTKDEDVINGIKAIRHKTGLSSSDTVVTCVSGKQVYAAQLKFKKMQEAEMKTALKFEIRKNLSFDTAGATIEYQHLTQPDKKEDTVPVIVTAVANMLLQRTLRLFRKAGVHLTIVDVLPLSVANTLWAVNEPVPPNAGPKTLIHIGPDFSTVVIDGEKTNFFNRTIYFSAAEIYDNDKDEGLAAREKERRLNAFTEEIARSLTFYSNTYKVQVPSSVSVLGAYCIPELFDTISRTDALSVEVSDFTEKFGKKAEITAGKYDVASILALRGLNS